MDEMIRRRRCTAHLFCLAALALLSACGPPALFPNGPTAIPTLFAATEPPSALEPTETPAFAVLSYPVRPPSAMEGHEIYQQECAQCHGEDGTGEVPGSRNFLDLDYIRGETPVNFYAAVTEGRGEMPSYNDRLSSDERWDVVFYIWRLSTTREMIQEGRKIYEQNCVTCHGENGDAELLGSANFRDLRQMDDLAPRDLYLVATQGRGSMPAWQSLLNQDQRWAVIDYIRTFSYDPELESSLAENTTATVEATAQECELEQQNPFAWDDVAAIQTGQEVYKTDCAGCHGGDGSGGLPDTPDFTSAAVQSELEDEPGEHFCDVLTGVSVMPAFGTRLSEQEIWSVITYLFSLGPGS
ncbi:MAG: c-type cytochrome [Anaerolineales bacterium]|jgi:mono/diheme cytochrome c family protein